MFDFLIICKKQDRVSSELTDYVRIECLYILIDHCATITSFGHLFSFSSSFLCATYPLYLSFLYKPVFYVRDKGS